MLKLFAVTLGGKAKGCNIELHDVVFIVTDNIENSYSDLINKWFGTPSIVHIDAYVELTNVDGYEISPTASNVTNDMNLYFINMGGYKKDYFGEMHYFNFIVAKSLDEAKIRAKALLQQSDITEPHIDNIIALNNIDNYYIQVKKSNGLNSLKLNVHAEYKKLIAKN
jgi:hypothetical protein